ncbi:MAG: phosphoglucosamine mutase, partial [Phycisphaerales bacterium]|nr:phosphoglucosamine mutase [Phycisphaerales bacterium]
LAEVITLNCSSSGVFPHTPEPTRENLSGSGGLCSVVPGVGADVGFAQDPDADRLAIIDEKGRYIGEEYTLVLSALALLELEDDPKDAVLVANLSTSRMIDDLAERFGARVERTPVGEAHVAQRMIELLADGQNVVLGGEGNGGVIWPEISFVRDSVVAMGLTLALMSRHGKPLSAIVDGLPGYSIVKRKQDIPSKDAAKPAIDAVAEAFKDRGRVDLQDGVRIDLDDQKAWLSLRASNTEPIVRLIAEAPDEAAANALLDEVQALLD